MTKKKALIYFIIFVIAVSLTAIWKRVYFYDPAQKFPDACKIVINPSCQQYLIKITKEKKYEEAVKIQKVRIKENEKILNFYKNKMKKIKKEDEKKYTLLIYAASFTLQDIVSDSYIVAKFEKEQLKDSETAEKTLKRCEKLLNKSDFYPAKKDALKLIQSEMKR